ncbi:MAG: hypothetical protein HRF49_04580 [bacterium]|jgi:hypothetical protein
MRFLAVAAALAAVLLFASPGFCQGRSGPNVNFGIGSLNGPTVELSSENWLVQGTWNLYFLDDDGFDDAWVFRADYVLPFGQQRGRSSFSRQASPTKFAVGYTYIDIEDDAGNNFTENGANVQFIYYFQPNVSFNATYDHFFDPDEGSIDNMISAGFIWHFGGS